MDREQRRKAYLEKAEEAERKAQSAIDSETRDGWRRIAESYREMARRT
jgi:hypothetical protein